MNTQSILRDFQRLETGVKTVFFGILLAVIFAFLPWFQYDTLQAEEGMRILRVAESSSGFGRFPIFGTLSVVFALASLAAFIQHFFNSHKTLGFEHGKWWLFLGGEALFTMIIALFVFSSEIRNDSTFDLRFGVFVTIIGHTLIVFGGYLTEKARQKTDFKQAFSGFPRSEAVGSLGIRPEEPSVRPEQLSLSDADERQQSILRR